MYMNENVKSAGRVLDLLELLAVLPAAVGTSEIARRLNIPKSSASMLIGTLESRGYVASDDARRFRLHEALRSEGGWLGGYYGLLRRLARPVMNQLVERTGETSFLGAKTPDHRLQYFEKVVSPNEVRFDADITDPRPLHCTAVGLVLLAFQEEGETEAFLAGAQLRRLTDKSITDVRVLRAELAKVRKRGLATAADAHVVGASGVAAPIFGPDGRILAGLNVSAPTWRFQKVSSRMVEELERAADHLNRLLSAHRPGRGTAA